MLLYQLLAVINERVEVEKLIKVSVGAELSVVSKFHANIHTFTKVHQRRAQ